MDYLKMLEHSFEMTKLALECPPDSRLEYLCDHVFDITTYDSNMSKEFGRRALAICAEINNGSTFNYIKSLDNYTWYLLMCNLPFFADRIEWGASIRGAWWKHDNAVDSYTFWINGEQNLDKLVFNQDQWKEFISALIDFASI